MNDVTNYRCVQFSSFVCKARTLLMILEGSLIGGNITLFH